MCRNTLYYIIINNSVFISDICCFSRWLLKQNFGYECVPSCLVLIISFLFHCFTLLVDIWLLQHEYRHQQLSVYPDWSFLPFSLYSQSLKIISMIVLKYIFFIHLFLGLFIDSFTNQRTSGPVNAHLGSAVYTNKHVLILWKIAPVKW